MTDNTPQPTSELRPQNFPDVPSEIKPESPPILSDAISPQLIRPKKTNKKLWTILGIAFGVLACCCLVGVAAIISVSMKSAKEKAPIEAVLDAYMKSMVEKDAESAYALFSPRAKRQIPLAKIQELTEGNNYFLFEGYQSISTSSVNISAAINTDPNKPQGTVAKVTGAITYKGGIRGSFNGTLEKVNEKWQIDGIFVTVPPNKIK